MWNIMPLSILVHWPFGMLRAQVAALIPALLKSIRNSGVPCSSTGRPSLSPFITVCGPDGRADESQLTWPLR